jgi:hypothetical protein
MKAFYTLFAAASLALFAPAVHASALGNEDPTEAARKATAREKVATAAKDAKAAKNTKKSSMRRLRKLKATLNHGMLVLLGLEDSKAVTSPAKLNRQLHAHQKHLKSKAKMEAKARRRRTSQFFN